MDETIDQVMRLVDDGQLTHEKSVELLNAFAAERHSAAALKDADTQLKARATAAIIKARHEISLFNELPQPDAERLGMVGVQLSPPTITFYESAIKGDATPTVTLRGKRYEQGTGPYLQWLLDRDPRFTPALVALINQTGSEGAALRDAIADGTVAIHYDHVLVSPDGKIQMARFHLDTPPILPTLREAQS
ncbi:MAG: hypothetical protein Q4D96_14165 [Propionibacteriaceae bacterium]|nr:hypothetical protein [Propionibacteriaceae bacterium]